MYTSKDEHRSRRWEICSGRWRIRPSASGQERGARDVPEVHLVGTLGVRTKGVCGVLLFTSFVNQLFIGRMAQKSLPPT